MNIKSPHCFFLLSIVFIFIFFAPYHVLSRARNGFTNPAGQGCLTLFLFPFLTHSVFQNVSVTKKILKKGGDQNV